MRPSSISFSSVMRATSRRIPSKDERTTAFGVSSMMKSTPVRGSSALMLRPRRLGGRARRHPLELIGDQIAGPAFRLGGGLLLELADATRELVPHLLLR